jgi:hypothetical protein
LQIDEQWKTAIRRNKGRIQINLMLVDRLPLTASDVRECTIITGFNKKILVIYYKIFGFDIIRIGPKLTEEDKPLQEEDFSILLIPTPALSSPVSRIWELRRHEYLCRNIRG